MGEQPTHDQIHDDVVSTADLRSVNRDCQSLRDEPAWKAPEEPQHGFLRRVVTWPGRWVRRQALRAVGADLFEKLQHERETLIHLIHLIDQLASAQTANNVATVKFLDDWMQRHAELLAQSNRAREELKSAIDQRIEQIQKTLDETERRAHTLWGTVDRKVGFLSEEAGLMKRMTPFFGESRGPEGEILRQQEKYVAEFLGCQRVIDIGCGRGEFLDLLRNAGIGAEGLDLEPEFVEACQKRGHTAHCGDLLEWLDGQPEASCDGIFCAQVVEHLPISTVDRFLAKAARVLKPDGRFIVETLNPNNLNIFMGPFWADPSHRNPIHPWTLSVMCQTRGFMENRVVFSARPPEEAQIKPLSVDGASGELQQCIDCLNVALSQINDSLYGYAHFAVIARRARPEEHVKT